MGIKDRIKELEGRGDEFDEFKDRIYLLECTKEFIKSFIGEDFYKDIAVDTKERIREIKNLSSAKTILFLFTKKAKEQGLQAELYDLEDRIVDWMCFNADSSENYFSIELFKRIILIALDDSRQSDKKEIEKILTIIRNGNETKKPRKRPEIMKFRLIGGFRRKRWTIIEANRKGETLFTRPCTRMEYLQTLLYPPSFIWIFKVTVGRKFRNLRNFLPWSTPKEEPVSRNSSTRDSSSPHSDPQGSESP